MKCENACFATASRIFVFEGGWAEYRLILVRSAERDDPKERLDTVFHQKD
jgi:hypothetical protein